MKIVLKKGLLEYSHIKVLDYPIFGQLPRCMWHFGLILVELRWPVALASSHFSIVIRLSYDGI